MIFSQHVFRALAAFGVAVLLVFVGAGNLQVPRATAGPVAFVVDSTVDEVDDAPGDGVCATAADECTLRAAIQETNALPGADMIELPAGEYYIAPNGSLEDEARTGDLDIRDELAIAGAGADTTIIDGNDDDRAIDVHAGAIVDISGVTMRGGHARGMGGGVLNDGTLMLADVEIVKSYASNNGGGIFNTGTLTVLDSTISRNDGTTCGGICNEAGGTLVIEDSVLLNNTAKFSGGGLRNAGDTTIADSIIADNAAEIGGGIDSWAGTVRISGSAIRGNYAVTCGGVCNDGTGIVIVEDSTIFGNTAEFEAGGLGSDGEVTITGTTIWNNTADMAGGLGNRGTMTIVDSIIENNDAISDSGGIGSDVGAFTDVIGSVVRGNTSATFAGISNAGTFTIRDSSIEDNVATVLGGGISNGGPMTIEGSTVSGNSAPAAGAVVNGIVGSLTIVNSTISANDATSSSALLNLGTATIEHSTIADNETSEGGAINTAGTVSLGHTLIGENTGANCSGNGTFLSDGYNLDDDNSCGLNATGDLAGVGPNVGPLADNGGPTLTHALLPASPAVEGGAADCTGRDQRGVERPQGAACDIGAFELEADLILEPEPEPPMVDLPDVGTGVGPSRGDSVWFVWVLLAVPAASAAIYGALRLRVS